MSFLFKVPPGYRLADGQQVEEGEKIMWMVELVEEGHVKEVRRTAKYILNEKDPQYQKLVEKFRRDTANLKKALKIELRESGLSVTLGKNATNRRMSFIIRSPYFASEMTDDEKAENVLQNNINRDTFILHFDEDYNLTQVRQWTFDFNDPSIHAKKFQISVPEFLTINYFRELVGDSLKNHASFFKENYAIENWAAIAQKITGILGEVIEKLGQYDFYHKLWTTPKTVAEILDSTEKGMNPAQEPDLPDLTDFLEGIPED